MPGYIHHIEWCVRELTETSNTLSEQFGFTITHSRWLKRKDSSTLLKQNVLQSGGVVFLLTENTCQNVLELEKAKIECDKVGHFPIQTCCESVTTHRRDTVFNVCLEVGQVEQVTDRIRQKSGRDAVIVSPTELTGKDGSVIKYSVVKSTCGNIVHTIINSKGNRSSFLPGFDFVSNSLETPLTSMMDHVTYVCESGQSRQVLDWYSHCFGMKRFLVNGQESIENGIEIKDEVGMRLTVGEWISSWLCREQGVQFEEEDSDSRNFKLVLAEPLVGRHDSHVQQFMDCHGGPGLQHIGLMADTKVEEVVTKMTQNGAQFRRPPPTYYQLPEKIKEIDGAGGDIARYRDLGLLLDSEADVDDNNNNDKFLIQVFSKPVFAQDTFFLEILERRGARGFGAGNITALAKSIIEYKKSLRKS